MSVGGGAAWGTRTTIPCKHCYWVLDLWFMSRMDALKNRAKAFFFQGEKLETANSTPAAPLKPHPHASLGPFLGWSVEVPCRTVR